MFFLLMLFALLAKFKIGMYSLVPNRRGVGIVRGVGGWKNNQNLISAGGDFGINGGYEGGNSPKFNRLFLFLSKIFLFSSTENEYLS